ncbi:MAG: cytochrome c oxidase assembly protein [Betaproteobacteria bacterium]|nr:MAG: cytochrome c oxidase assembly protein [Betaproteobacteria bacterium]
MSDLRDDPRRSNRVMLAKLGVVVVVMFGFGFLLVPFYDQICKATGLRDIDVPDEVKNTQVDLTRSVRLELDANASKLPWRFRPLTPIVTVHPGEVAQVVYEVENTSEHPVTGQAVPSYGPQLAAQYFRKLDCFCFTKQSLAPHEKRQMPVVFVVDPKLPNDVPTITLSYTFFEVEGNRS